MRWSRRSRNWTSFSSPWARAWDGHDVVDLAVSAAPAFDARPDQSGGLRTTRSGRVMFTVGRLVGSCSPATDNDGHATKRPSTLFEHRRRLIQPTRKPSDLFQLIGAGLLCGRAGC